MSVDDLAGICQGVDKNLPVAILRRSTCWTLKIDAQ